MTQHVRTGYRNHRRAAWGIALLFAAAVAAITIPLASGASPNQTLRFMTQAPTPWQSSTPTAANISVAVFSGGPDPVRSNPPPTPVLTASGAGDISNFTVSAPMYSSGTKSWTWSVAPKSTANSGSYRFGATLGTLSATSSTFRVVQFICPASGGPSCNGTSNFGTAGQGKLNIANTLGSPILLDFQPGGAAAPLGCNNDVNIPSHTWNRAFFLDASGNKVYFPAVALDFTWGSQMLQITYMVRNSEWVKTEATRGNQDIDFCAEATASFLFPSFA